MSRHFTIQNLGATHQDTVTGQDKAQRVAAYLVGQSCWFVSMPMPDDVWEFTVKMDAASCLVLAKDLT